MLSGDYNATAALFPRWVALASVIFVILVAAAQLLGTPIEPSEPAEDFSQVSSESSHWPAVLGLQAAYILGIYLLGFPIATLLYLIVAPIQMYYRRWGMIGLQAVLLTAIISGSFIRFFHIRLPKGIVWSLW